MSEPIATATLNRDLLRAAGEHLGALAEQSREQMELSPHSWQRGKPYNRFAKLLNLSRGVLEIANG